MRKTTEALHPLARIDMPRRRFLQFPFMAVATAALAELAVTHTTAAAAEDTSSTTGAGAEIQECRYEERTFIQVENPPFLEQMQQDDAALEAAVARLNTQETRTDDESIVHESLAAPTPTEVTRVCAITKDGRQVPVMHGEVLAHQTFLAFVPASKELNTRKPTASERQIMAALTAADIEVTQVVFDAQLDLDPQLKKIPDTITFLYDYLRGQLAQARQLLNSLSEDNEYTSFLDERLLKRADLVQIFRTITESRSGTVTQDLNEHGEGISLAQLEIRTGGTDSDAAAACANLVSRLFHVPDFPNDHHFDQENNPLGEVLHVLVQFFLLEALNKHNGENILKPDDDFIETARLRISRGPLAKSLVGNGFIVPGRGVPDSIALRALSSAAMKSVYENTLNMSSLLAFAALHRPGENAVPELANTEQNRDFAQTEALLVQHGLVPNRGYEQFGEPVDPAENAYTQNTIFMNVLDLSVLNPRNYEFHILALGSQYDPESDAQARGPIAAHPYYDGFVYLEEFGEYLPIVGGHTLHKINDNCFSILLPKNEHIILEHEGKQITRQIPDGATIYLTVRPTAVVNQESFVEEMSFYHIAGSDPFAQTRETVAELVQHPFSDNLVN